MSAPAASRRYVGVPEVAARYGVNVSTVYEWVAGGLVPYRKLPGRKRLFFDPADLDRYDDGAVKLERRKLPGGGVVVKPKAAAS